MSENVETTNLDAEYAAMQNFLDTTSFDRPVMRGDALPVVEDPYDTEGDY